MYATDVEIVRVYTRNPGGIADTTFSTTLPLDVVIEAEAGAGLLGGLGPFEAGVVLRDLSTSGGPAPNSHVIPTTPPVGAWFFGPGSLWATAATQLVFTVPAASLAGRVNHICEVIAYIKVPGAGSPNVVFGTSRLFMFES